MLNKQCFRNVKPMINLVINVQKKKNAVYQFTIIDCLFSGHGLLLLLLLLFTRCLQCGHLHHHLSKCDELFSYTQCGSLQDSQTRLDSLHAASREFAVEENPRPPGKNTNYYIFLNFEKSENLKRIWKLIVNTCMNPLSWMIATSSSSSWLLRGRDMRWEHFAPPRPPPPPTPPPRAAAPRSTSGDWEDKTKK